MCGLAAWRFDGIDQHAGGNGVVAQAVDQNKAARVAVAGVGVERDHAVKLELHHADFIHTQLSRWAGFLRIHIQLVAESGDGGLHRFSTDFEQKAAACADCLLVHPNQVGFKLIAHASGLV